MSNKNEEESGSSLYKHKHFRSAKEEKTTQNSQCDKGDGVSPVACFCRRIRLKWLQTKTDISVNLNSTHPTHTHTHTRTHTHRGGQSTACCGCVEKKRVFFDVQTHSSALALQTVVFKKTGPHTYNISKHKQWQHSDMNFPSLCLLLVMMKFTHRASLTHRKRPAEWWQDQYSWPHWRPKLCYLQLLLR